MNPQYNDTPVEQPILVIIVEQTQLSLDEIRAIKRDISSSIARIFTEPQIKDTKPPAGGEESPLKSPTNLVEVLELQRNQINDLREDLYSINWKLKKLI